MSVYSNVTEEDMIALSKLSEQQKNQKINKIKNRILKQTHNKELAETFKPITDKLEKMNSSITNQNFIPFQKQIADGVNVSDSLIQTFAFMNKAKNFFKAVRNSEGKLSWNDKIITPLGQNRIKINDAEFDLSPEIQKAMTQTNYNFRNMDDGDVVNFEKILNSVGYTPSLDTNSTRSKYIKNNLKNRVKEILNPIQIRSLPTTDTEIDSDQNMIGDSEPSSSNIEGSGISKIIIPSNIIDIWTRLEVLLGLKLSGHTDTLTEASHLIDELYKRGEIKNKRQYKNALDKFLTQ